MLSLSAQPDECPLRDPDELVRTIISRHRIYHYIRDFFTKRDYIEVETPIMVPSPGIDPYIDAIPVGGGMYLATSPELQMKRLLGMGMKRIFQLTRAFRYGEQGKLHNPEFSLLEWYQADKDYLYLMDEVESFIRDLVASLGNQGVVRLELPSNTIPRYNVDELFKTYTGWIPSRDWDEERFFLDLVEKVEPRLASEPAVIIYDFPAPLASMARLKPGMPNLCERFELYLDGLEVANAFSELTNPQEQMERFIQDRMRRKRMGKDPHPIDYKFLRTLEQGLLPPCTGIAMGLDRLIMALTGKHHIDDVMAFPMPLL